MKLIDRFFNHRHQLLRAELREAIETAVDAETERDAAERETRDLLAAVGSQQREIERLQGRCRRLDDRYVHWLPVVNAAKVYVDHPDEGRLDELCQAVESLRRHSAAAVYAEQAGS